MIKVVGPAIGDPQENAKDIRATISIAPWFTTLTTEFADAGNRALQPGVRPEHVYHAIKAGLNEVLRDALRVNVDWQGQGGQNP